MEKHSKESTMLKIEIIVHCWLRSSYLAMQLSSLITNAPQLCRVIVTIVHTASDIETTEVIEHCANQLGSHNENLIFNPVITPRQMLMRRAIERHSISKGTAADWVWFADCDYLFGHQCLDAAARMLPHVEESLAYPQFEFRCSAEGGDRFASAIMSQPLKIYTVKSQDFSNRKLLRKASGGALLARGSAVRSRGYNIDDRAMSDHWQDPSEDDMVFIKSFASRPRGLPIPSLLRVAHSLQAKQ